jgi:N-acetylglucosaminyldiphosphoundecaprenol N-acetyl-beta-D-mannosaminyltransferase
MEVMTKLSKIHIFNIDIDNVNITEAVEIIHKLVLNRSPSYVVTPNVDHIVKLNSDPFFKEVYDHASLTLTDGAPLLWAAKFLRIPLKEKISGSDLFPKLCALAADRGYRLFFLGGRPGAVDKGALVMRDKHPHINIEGTYCPPLGFENNLDENTKIIELIKETHPDILFVGLGTPKQEKWIYRHKDRYLVPVSIGIGAGFDFVAGMVKRAPVWMQKAGLEWFWRLMIEPGRLWKRYLIDDMQFFRLILKLKIGSKYERDKRPN